MARLSTKYDSDLKEQVLVLRGDEGYARSTTTFLELGNPSIQTDDFDLPVTVNVLRDRDDGTILIYDNDVLAYSIEDWSAQDNARTVTLTGLAFDIQHNIVARYMGNNKCSPSRSTVQTISVEDTRRTEAILTLETGTTQFNTNDSYTDTIILSNTLDEEYNQNQLIEIYYDGVLVDTVNTGETGQVDFTIPVGANGLHNIRFHFEATNHLTDCDLSVDLSVGYEVTITSYPKVMVKGGNYSVTANIKDYFGNLQDVENISNVKLWAISGQGITVQNFYWNMNRISEGVYSITISITFGHLDIHTISVGLWNGNIIRYSSVDISVNVISIYSLTITSSTPQLYKNERNVMSIQSSSVVEGIPIQLTGAVEETVYTESNGVATKVLTGEGIGSKIITASAGDATASITLDDFIQYWEAGQEPVNQSYELYPSSLTQLHSLNNYYRLDVTEKAQGTGLTSYGRGVMRLTGSVALTYEYTLKNVRPSRMCALEIIGEDIIHDEGSTATVGLVNNESCNITVRRNGTNLKIFVNEEEVHSLTIDSKPHYPTLCFLNFSTSDNLQVQFTKLTYRWL